MLKAFLKTKEEVLLALEDDVVFGNIDALDAALDELPKDWDLLYLGANITGSVFGIKERPPVKHSDHLHRVRAAWTTHAVAYPRRIVEVIVSHYQPQTFEMYDQWLNANILPHYKCFLVNPMVAYQRPGKSDLWNCHADYTGAFEASNKIMSK